MPKKRLLQIIILLFAISVVVGTGWFFFPWPDRVHHVSDGSRSYHVKTERRFWWVQNGNPQQMPGGDRTELFFSETIDWCGGRTSKTVTTRRFAFFEIT